MSKSINSLVLIGLLAGPVAAAPPSSSVRRRPILFEARRPRDVVLVSGHLDAPVAVAPDGEVVYVADDGVLARVERDGHQRWSFLVGSSRGAPTLDVEGNVYVASREATLYSLDPSGSTRWRRPMEGVTSYAVAVDAQVVAAALETGQVAFWQRSRGRPIALVSTGARPSGAPVLAAGGRAIVPTADGSVLAVTADSVAWRARVARAARCSPVAIGAAGEVYVGTEDGFVARVSTEGRVEWRTSAGGPVTRSPAIGEDGVVYVIAGTDLVALSADGKIRWRHALRMRIVGGPLVTDDGSVLVSGAVRDAREQGQGQGKVLRTTAMGEAGAPLLLPAPPLPGISLYDHSLWLAFPDFTLRRLHISEGSLAHSSWPKPRGDLFNSGTSPLLSPWPGGRRARD